MTIELDPKEAEMILTELESGIQDLRALIASGMRKELRDDIRSDKIMLTEIVDKIRAAVEAGEQKAAA